MVEVMKSMKVTEVVVLVVDCRMAARRSYAVEVGEMAMTSRNHYTVIGRPNRHHPPMMKASCRGMMEVLDAL